MEKLAAVQRLSNLATLALFAFVTGCASGGREMSEQELLATSGRPDFRQVEAEFEAAEQAEIAARNAAVEAEFRGQAAVQGDRAAKEAAIQREASELFERYQTAGPEERRRIEHRAEELAREAEALNP